MKQEIPILWLRGLPVILDLHLALLYGVKTKRLIEQVRRNSDRFPDDFVFRLSKKGMGRGGRKLRPVRQDIAFQYFTYGFYRARGANGVDGASFITPAGYWHSHHNESGEDAHVLPIQDAGLHTYLRTLDILYSHPSHDKTPTFPSGLDLQGLVTTVLFEFDFTLDQYTFTELFSGGI
jgi:hypothetical protein